MSKSKKSDIDEAEYKYYERMAYVRTHEYQLLTHYVMDERPDWDMFDPEQIEDLIEWEIKSLYDKGIAEKYLQSLIDDENAWIPGFSKPEIVGLNHE